MMKPDKNSAHLAGEYFVAAELYKRGFSVGLTIGNAKAIDLFAGQRGKTRQIQVKAIRTKKGVGWPIKKAQIKQNVIYVFVCLNQVDEHPDYFICTSKEAKEKVKEYRIRGIINLRDLKTSQYQSRWDKIDP